MSSPDRSGELLAIAERVVGMAAKGEQVEAYVSRGLSTDVRVYEGEVEHFVSAQSEGIGIRVIRDGRTGTSYCGTLDEECWRYLLCRPRYARKASPAAVPEAPRRHHRDRSRKFPGAAP